MAHKHSLACGKFQFFSLFHFSLRKELFVWIFSSQKIRRGDGRVCSKLALDTPSLSLSLQGNLKWKKKLWNSKNLLLVYNKEHAVIARTAQHNRPETCFNFILYDFGTYCCFYTYFMLNFAFAKRFVFLILSVERNFKIKLEIKIRCAVNASEVDCLTVWLDLSIRNENGRLTHVYFVIKSKLLLCIIEIDHQIGATSQSPPTTLIWQQHCLTSHTFQLQFDFLFRWKQFEIFTIIRSVMFFSFFGNILTDIQKL